MLNNFNKYTYKIEMYLSYSNGDSEDVSNLLKSITVNNNYEKYVFPIITANFSLTSEMFIRIQNNDNLKLTMNIVRYVDISINNEGISMPFDYYLKDIVMIPINKNRSPIDVDTFNTEVVTSVPNISIDLALMLEDNLKINKFVASGIYRDCTMEDIITFLLNDISNKLVFQKPDNQYTLDQVILIPNNIIMNIRYINDVYGIYNSGMNLFFGMKNYYLISKLNNIDTPYIGNNYKDVVLNILDNSDDPSGIIGQGSYKDNESLSYNVKSSTNTIFVNNNNFSMNEVYGNKDVILSNNVDGINMREYNIDNTREKKKIFYNRYDNHFKENEFLNTITNSTLINYTFKDIDLDCVDCNKIYKLVFSNHQYKHLEGKYQIIKNQYIFNVDSKGNANVDGNILLRKI